MNINSGYLNQTRVPYKDTVRPLTVSGCGTYRLFPGDRSLPSAYPKGRVDYQLLYVAAGQAYFMIDGKEECIQAGTMVLYYPREPQRYIYYGDDSPEVFWVHFTGYDVRNILKYYAIQKGCHVFYTGTSLNFKRIFQQMILELQCCRSLYEDMLSTYLNTLFLLIGRSLLETPGQVYTSEDEVEIAVSYFNAHYSEHIVIEEYAASRNISKGWFIRLFRLRMGMTPVQYLSSIRLTYAQTMLEQSDYNISQIAASVGYDNALYFTRRFSKSLGMSPTEYRRKYGIQNQINAKQNFDKK